MNYRCPKCGSAAKLLLNIVGCLTSTCRNYDRRWEQEWRRNNKPHYIHHSSEHQFLGNFTGSGRTDFDLYSWLAPTGYELCFARFGKNDDYCYYVDNNETEIGTVSCGPTKTAPPEVVEALKEALRRYRGH